MTEHLDVTTRDDGVLHVRLDRPEVHNAFNETLIAELHATFTNAAGEASVRAVLLTGNGPSFSAGADIAWMREQGQASLEDNRAGAKRMASMFHAIYSCPKPVLAGIHGAALGGGTGLAAVADIAIAEESAVFGFTEVRLGIVPAVISPFVVEKLGVAKARALFLTGERFDGREAERVGLVFRCCPDGELEAHLDRATGAVLASAPNAVLAAKQLTQSLSPRPVADDLDRVAECIAELRGSPEAQEGLEAFLNKRKASWRTD